MENKVETLISDFKNTNERCDKVALEHVTLTVERGQTYATIMGALKFKFKKMKTSTQLNDAISLFKHAIDDNQNFIKKAIEIFNKLIKLVTEIETQPTLAHRAVELIKTEEIKTTLEAYVVDEQLTNLIKIFKYCQNKVLPSLKKSIDSATEAQDYFVETYEDLCDRKAKEEGQSI